MLSKQNRLSIRTERVRLEKEGSTRHSPLFIVVSAPRSPVATPLATSSRFAILVTKKLAPLSVDRHRLRRLITELLRHHLDKFPQGRDFLLIPKRTIFSADQNSILSDLLQALNT